MTGFQATTNADELGRALLAAADDLVDLAPVNAEAGRVVLAAARPPRRTGTLAASARSSSTPYGTVIGYPVRYATYVHWGAPRRHMRAQPWLLAAATASRDEVADLYADHAADTLRRL